MVKAVIFDYYGVLNTDQYITWLRRHPEVVRQYPDEVDDLSHAQDAGLADEPFMARLAGLAGRPVAEVQAELEIRCVIHWKLLTYIAGLRQLGLKTAILSNAPAHLHTKIVSRKLGTLFDDIICSQEVGLVKPDPRAFELALGRLGVAPAETVFVDDRPYNVHGARDVGMIALDYSSLAKLRRDLARLGITPDPQAAVTPKTAV